jgi:hypothetical protein
MKMIEDQVKLFVETSCIKFIERKNETNWIEIFSGDGCYSYRGYLGGKQRLSLKRSGCLSKDLIIHELLHALGFMFVIL